MPLWREVAVALTERAPDPLAVAADVTTAIAAATRLAGFVRTSGRLKLTKGGRSAIKDIVLTVWPEAKERDAVLSERLPTQSFLMVC